MNNFSEEPQEDTCDDQEGKVGLVVKITTLTIGKTMDSWERPLVQAK